MNLLSKALTLVVSESKEFYDIQLLSAISYTKIRKYNEAIKIFVGLFKAYPNEPYYIASYGILKENMCKYDSALELL